ncbi:uncharacterized protein LOC127734816 [Mytilus californianus]|uniref:uncharacterized protein LOC127734816 n=1 Tax=Mytilus californianus TaxID=6549 RepID=UPI0022482126|nr:uncharacterized protein LOC127734816 [Mytilus californianus]
MATNYKNINGDHSGEEDVRAKSFTTPRISKPSKDTHAMSQKYPSSGISQQITNQFQETPAVRQKQFQSGGQNMYSAGFQQQYAGIPNHMPDMSGPFQTRNQFTTPMGPPVMEPPNYSTSEQVQYLASQVFEILQEIREIRGFAGLINSINTKVEYMITQNNELRSVLDNVQSDVNTVKNQPIRYVPEDDIDSEEETPHITRSYEQPFKYDQHISGNGDQNTYKRTVDTSHGQSLAENTINNEPSSLVSMDNGGQRSVAESTRPLASIPQTDEIYPPGSQNKAVPVYGGKDSIKETAADTTHITFKQEKPNVQSLPVPAPVQKKTVEVATGPMSLMSGRQYKCKKTDNSDDNRLSHSNMQSDQEDSDTEVEPVAIVRPQPRPKSPKIVTDMKEEFIPGKSEMPRETYPDFPDDMKYPRPKEDQFLEQLALSENFKARDCLDPKSTGADTVICIDTSESMTGESFKACVNFVNQFVDYIEEWATEYTIEENVAIVHFGSEARILQQLTNDYNKVREAVERMKCGGPTPMMTGLVVAMSALFNRGGPVTVHDRQINPRVILLSDGKATDHRIFEGQDMLQPNGLSWEMISDKLEDFAERVKLENRHITCVPVGSDARVDVLKILAETTGGVVSSLDKVRHLSRSFFVEVMISQTRYEGITEDIRTNRQEIAALARNLQNGRELSEVEMNEVVTKVIQETEEEIEIQRLREQQRNEIDEESEMEVGLRVRRGPDWMWGDQDGFGTGTVIGHKSRGYVRVKWDCGNVGRYRHGAQNAHDLVVVDEPRILPDEVLIAEGVYVKKGRDWEWDEQDGGDGSVGCVYHVEDEGIVHVRWENGIRGNYRYGGFGKIDLETITPRDYERIKEKRKRNAEKPTSNIPREEAPIFQNIGSNIQTDGPGEEPGEATGFQQPNINNINPPQTGPTSQREPFDTSNIQQDSKSQPADSSDETASITPATWQYNKDGEWQDYSENDCSRIEKLFSTRKSGTVIVNINGDNCRVIPHKLKQKNTKTEVESTVRRLE